MCNGLKPTKIAMLKQKQKSRDSLSLVRNHISLAIKKFRKAYGTSFPAWNNERLVVYVTISTLDFITASHFTIFIPSVVALETFIAVMSVGDSYGKDLLNWLGKLKQHFIEYKNVSKEQTYNTIRSSVTTMQNTFDFVMHPKGQTFLRVIEKGLHKIHNVEKMSKAVDKLLELLQ